MSALRSGITSGPTRTLGSGFNPWSGAAPPANPDPVAAFTSSVNKLVVTFTDGSTDDGSVASWAWDFGDSLTSTSQNPVHTYATGGAKTVTLTVTDNLGAFTSISHVVTAVANVAPVAAYTHVELLLQSTFTDTSSDGDGTVVSWAWAFGDGNTSTSQNPVHTYATSGTYTVQLTVTDSDGATNAVSHSVTVLQRSTITWTHLITNSSTVNASSVATASITPVANKPIYAGIIAVAPSGTGATPTLTGCGLTWVAVGNVTVGAVTNKLTVFRSIGASPTAGALTFDFAGQTQNSYIWSVMQPTGAVATGTAAADSVVQSAGVNGGAGITTVSGVLAAFENAKNHHLSFAAIIANATITLDADFTQLGQDGETSSAITLASAYAANQTVCDPTFSSTTAGIFSLEIKSGAD